MSSWWINSLHEAAIPDWVGRIHAILARGDDKIDETAKMIKVKYWNFLIFKRRGVLM
jgi:hypothetical protein